MANPKPVFDKILDSCARLFGAGDPAVCLVDGDLLRIGAYRGKFAEEVEQAFPRPLAGTISDMAVRQGSVLYRPSVLAAGDMPDYIREVANRRGDFSVVNAPMTWNGRAIGTIDIICTPPRLFSDAELGLVRTFADQAVIAIQNARLFNETQEALARQTATADILRVISGSPTDVQPVFDAIVGTAVRLLSCDFAILIRCDGSTYSPAAGALRDGPMTDMGPSVVAIDPALNFPSRAIVSKAVLHLPDWSTLELPAHERIIHERLNVNCALYIPLLRDGECIGLMALARARAQAVAFADAEIALAQSFVDQALIAVENARLFNETKAALERQTATAEILKVISSSPTDTQPVFDAIVASAARLFGRKAALRTVEEDGLRRRARSYAADDEFHGADLMAIDRNSLVGRAVIECRALQDADTHAPTATPYARAHSEQLAFRSIASAPLVREGAAIGVISVSSPEPGALSDKQMALLTTFADQAVIAIENARLFNETQEALERQTATADVLKVISESPTDVQPVFEAIAERARTLCDAKVSGVTRLDGEWVHLVAYRGASRESEDAMRGVFPVKANGTTLTGRAIRERMPVQIADVLAEPSYGPKEAARLAGFRANLAVPMMREGQVVGAISVCRAEAGPFPEKQVQLLQTFADQAVIAIENARLFKETQDALANQTATADILRVISGSPTSVQPVFDAIVTTAVRLLACDLTVVVLRKGNSQSMVAGATADGSDIGIRPGDTPIDPATNFPSRVFATGRMLHVPDWTAIELPERERRIHASSGMTASLMVPMVREGECIGVLVFGRKTAGPFRDAEIALAESFADQALIAIENVRLFNETKEALERQTATAEVLQVISNSVADTAPVFDKILDSCEHLFATEQLGIFLVGNDGQVRVGAWRGSALGAIARGPFRSHSSGP